jgi:hypothetical protein
MIRTGLRVGLTLGAATLLLHLVLILPNHPGALVWRTLFSFPLELPLIVLALLATGTGKTGQALRIGITFVLTAMALLKLADLVSFDALSRPFNPVADLFLVDAFVRLLTGTLGPVLAGVAVLAAIAGIALVATLVWWATGVWSRARTPLRLAPLVTGVALVAGAVVAVDVAVRAGHWSLPAALPGEARTTGLALRKVVTAATTVQELRSFRVAVVQDPFAGRRDLLDRIDRDVIVIFIESYGRTSFDTPYFAETHRATLTEFETKLAAQGLAMRSGFLAAPTRGGQSWLSHATLANGLWIDNQVSYGAALSSGREGLFHHAANNGFRTAAVMPQITLDWPEAARMGFETILAAKDLGYRGLAFNWVTMPDQFTLAALDRLLRDGSDERRLFAQVALSSSHAPWVPVPQMVPWESVGDGQIFNVMAQAGDPPEVVWRDRERVRFQYRLAIDYALRAVLDYALLQAEDPPLLIVVGDHQAAGAIALDERPDVPLHIIGPEHLVSPLASVAPDPGLVPQEGRAVVEMNLFRDILLDAYSAGPSTEAMR